MEKKCRYCKHHKPFKNKCELDYKCKTIGCNPDELYSEFEFVGEDKAKEIDKIYEEYDIKAKKEKRSIILTISVLIIFLLLILAYCLVSGYYRFSNPELTETQLMIWSLKKFWWLLIIVGGLGFWIKKK